MVKLLHVPEPPKCLTNTAPYKIIRAIQAPSIGGLFHLLHPDRLHLAKAGILSVSTQSQAPLPGWMLRAGRWQQTGTPCGVLLRVK